MIRFSIFALAAIAFSVAPGRGVMVDLTEPVSSGSVLTPYGTAFFTTDTTQPTGTGVFEPFLTIQRVGIEEGYNSSAQNAPFDAKRIPVWNHEFTVAEMKANASVQLGSEIYYRFLIDINEPNALNATDDKPLISLDSLKMFTTSTAGQTTLDIESLGVKRFDLNPDPLNPLLENYVLYDDRNHGSGESDIAFMIPASAFAAALDSDYVYMYQKFGEHAAADPRFANTTEGGFEETRFGGLPSTMTIPPVPEVSTALPLAAFMLMATFHSFRLRRREFAPVVDRVQ